MCSSCQSLQDDLMAKKWGRLGLWIKAYPIWMQPKCLVKQNTIVCDRLFLSMFFLSFFFGKGLKSFPLFRWLKLIPLHMQWNICLFALLFSNVTSSPTIFYANVSSWYLHRQDRRGSGVRQSSNITIQPLIVIWPKIMLARAWMEKNVQCVIFSTFACFFH